MIWYSNRNTSSRLINRFDWELHVIVSGKALAAGNFSNEPAASALPLTYNKRGPSAETQHEAR